MKGKLKKQNKTIIATLLLIGSLAFLPQTQALTPPPDGCYPNFTTAEGCNALQSLSSGTANTGLGAFTLFSTTTASFNTAVGAGALDLNTGDSNTAVGVATLLLNTGTENTALGVDALGLNTTGAFNAAVGAFALYNNADGGHNSALGVDALSSNVSGGNCTAVGNAALQNSTGDFNTAIGAGAGTDPDIMSNNVYIGDPGFAGDENVISIGGIAASGTDYTATYIGGIAGAEVNAATSMPVYIDSVDGHLGTTPVNGSAKHLRIRNPKGAQHQVKASEFQNQQKRIAELESTVARLVATVKEQAAQIEKVNAKLEVQTPAQRVVANKQ